MHEQPPAPQEQPESHENAPVTKEQVLDIYSKTVNGKEDGPAKELLISWIEQHYSQIETISDSRERNHALITFEFEKAELYFETGFDDVALEELEGDGYQEGLLELASHRGEDELHEKILQLIDKIKNRIISTGETLASSNIIAPDLESLSVEELKKQQAQADADQIFELSAQIKEMLNKKS